MATTDLNIEIKANDKASAAINKTQNSLKRFSKGFKENWLAITAAVTGSVIAIGKTWDAIKLGAQAEQQMQAFQNLADSFGVNADQIIADLRRASGETLSTMQLIEQASKAMALGLDPKQFAKLMEISRGAARAMGEDVDFMFQSIVLGIGRQSRMILDNLGIIVKAEQAYDNYAKSLGKTAEALTENEKRLAFTNAAIEGGMATLKRLDISQKTNAERIQALSASWSNFTTAIAEAISKLRIVNFTIAKTTEFIDSLNDIINFFSREETALERITRLQKQYSNQLREIIKERDRLQSVGKIFDPRAQENLNRIVQILRDLQAEQQKIKEANFWENVDKAVRRSQQVFIAAENKKAESFLKTSEIMLSISQNLAMNMSNTLGSIFFDVFVGRLNSLGDHLRNFGRNMLNFLSQVAARMLLIKGFEKAASVATGGISTFFGNAAKALGFQTGTDSVPRDGIFRLHKGERVIPAHEADRTNIPATIVNNFITPPADVDATQVASIITKDIESRGLIAQSIKNYI